jgi:catechol 2,3-dioxygenase-like lactoylglutathione lyase family enzyme
MYVSGNTTVMVKDFARAFRFYAETLGLDVKLRAADDWAEMTAPGLTIGLHAATHGEPTGGAPGVSIGLQVANLDDAMGELKAKGVQFARVIDADQRRFAYFTDPDGTWLYLAQLPG